MSNLQLEGVSKHYDGNVAVESMDLSIQQGEFIALLGPSGCGKTTTLRMIAGFVKPSAGRIVISKCDVTDLPPHRREIGLVFQSYALFSHMTVAQNVAFGLEMRGVPRADRESRTREALDLVRMGSFIDRYPRQLSGGQQQRVALARSLVISPSVLLLDEPLSNLDAKLRAEVRDEIRELQQRLGLTTLMVTHDQEEALTMADRLVVMNKGRVCQVGGVRDVFERPSTAFVANFVSRCNLIEGWPSGAGAFETKAGFRLACEPENERSVQGACLLAIRPDRITIDAQAKDGGGLIGRLLQAVYVGAETEYLVDVAGVKLSVVRPTPYGCDPLRTLEISAPVHVSWNASDARLVADTAW